MKRKAFANDLAYPQLLALFAASNRSKGGQGPDEWQPLPKSYWCTHICAWVSVKAKVRLRASVNEKTTLTDMPGSRCP
ncbi:hypothetical protein [Streptomyces sp. MUM 16J]|uniref:hypothetical protein n=1 Tax=Streptomyces sp. MUM 16J TaxID=2791988 RepID=UPI001F036B3D|nr:hypothetical protein [Streptomyces sp. MUM 16J]MCH0561396.1 hypothetical protein [Streptomyces sp. MUM 16J]